LQVVEPKVTWGLAPHVPLNLHHAIIALIFVILYCVDIKSHVCPPVVEIVSVPDAALATAKIIHKSPSVIEEGGVIVLGLAVLVPLSSGTVATPKNVIAILC
jgi:hypothetical protein